MESKPAHDPLQHAAGREHRAARRVQAVESRTAAVRRLSIESRLRGELHREQGARRVWCWPISWGRLADRPNGTVACSSKLVYGNVSEECRAALLGTLSKDSECYLQCLPPCNYKIFGGDRSVHNHSSNTWRASTFFCVTSCDSATTYQNCGNNDSGIVKHSQFWSGRCRNLGESGRPVVPWHYLERTPQEPPIRSLQARQDLV